MRIARVFPRRTKATPTDPLAFVGPPGLFPPEVDEVHISVTFTWDLPEAERLAKEWAPIAPVAIGGPATGMRGEEFTPGMYLRDGYVITSRGCPNRCWFCSVWKREGQAVRELPICDGWNVLDDNLLACSEGHIRDVFTMLRRQKRRPELTGGLEAARFAPWHAEALREIRTEQLFFAYDTPDDWEPLERAARLCWDAGFSPRSHAVRAYVLCGWPKDTIREADARMWKVAGLGIMPMAMPWRGADGKVAWGWRQLGRKWARGHIVGAAMREVA